LTNEEKHPLGEVDLRDWDGFLANPTTGVLVTFNGPLPATVTLRADDARLYFDLPSTVGANGPTKVLHMTDRSPMPVEIGIFPDRDGVDEPHKLTISVGDTTLEAPLIVHDEDLNRPMRFHITADFSRDQTHFFDDPKRRAIVQQAADDWAYFIDADATEVAPGEEQTWNWDATSLSTGHAIRNQTAYRGFLLYAYGVSTSALRSGGEGSRDGGFLRGAGIADGTLRRSGGLEIEPLGNFNRLGWFLTTSEDDWCTSANAGEDQNDLYSIAHHEMGHALAFNPAYPRFERSKSAGALDSPEIREYLGRPAAIDTSDHMQGVVDPASQRGAFGNEYHGDVPARRWLITKLDLLALSAIGYPIRNIPAGNGQAIERHSDRLGAGTSPAANQPSPRLGHATLE
jgi:hypothetical protein